MTKSDQGSSTSEPRAADTLGKGPGEAQATDTLDKSSGEAGAITAGKVRTAKTYAGMTRRTLLLGAGSVAVLMGIGSVKLASATPLVRPPGGQNEDQLIAGCIRCEKCYEVCPRGVIAPAHIEDGLLAMRTPTFNFARDYCNWCSEENNGEPLCVKACPTKALELPAGATPENTILGKAVLREDWCLAHRLITCRFCYDACPYEAMELDEVGRPYVIADKCNGCGACESVCVSLQNASVVAGATKRAITVHPEGVLGTGAEGRK